MTESPFFNRINALLSYSSKDSSDAKRIYSVHTGHASLAVTALEEIEALSSERSAHLIRLAYAIAERRVTDSFRFGICHSDEEVIRYFQAKLYSKAKEASYLMLFDKDGKAISCEFLGEGTVNFLAVAPRTVLEVAIKKKATDAVIAHNHPGGIAKASCEDIEATRIIAELFEASGRRLKAHYIFAGDKYDAIIPGTTE